jgi:hypothetical protein
MMVAMYWDLWAAQQLQGLKFKDKTSVPWEFSWLLVIYLFVFCSPSNL